MTPSPSLNSRKATANNGLGDDETEDQSVSLSQKGFRSRAVEVDAPSTVRVWTDPSIVFTSIPVS